MRRTVPILALALWAIPSHAALIGRAPVTPGGSDYQAYFDTAQNITWLADANLAAFNTFAVSGIIDAGQGPGQMTWATANAYIGAMNGAAYLGATHWRLPATLQPDPTCSQQYNNTSYQFGCSGSEMGHLFYVDGISWGSLGTGYPGGFAHIQANYYWSGTEYALDPDSAWNNNFQIGYGGQYHALKTNYNNVWAVIDGDPLAVVPVPAAAWLFCGALGLLGLSRRQGGRGLPA